MPGEPRNGAQIYNSNAYLFAGLLREYGFGQIGYMHVTDKASELDTEITRIFSASMEVDIIISTGFRRSLRFHAANLRTHRRP